MPKSHSLLDYRGALAWSPESLRNRAKRMHCPGIVCYAPMDGSPSPPTRMPSKHSDYALKQRESMCGMAA